MATQNNHDAGNGSNTTSASPIANQGSNLKPGERDIFVRWLPGYIREVNNPALFTGFGFVTHALMNEMAQWLENASKVTGQPSPISSSNGITEEQEMRFVLYAQKMDIRDALEKAEELKEEFEKIVEVLRAEEKDSFDTEGGWKKVDICTREN